ncbi:hypothetical protein FDUTEX481_03580 [Tolypothrix sp. PCC 7601]|nr:hypothetical protein FDUTEX481_03580 [Tolypothrix sp. PCC 7601]
MLRWSYYLCSGHELHTNKELNTCRLKGKRGMGKGKEKTFNP